MSTLEWSPTTEEDVASLVRLGQACLDRDGGLPDLADPQHLLDTVRADLDAKTVEEFVREWRVVD